jgi:hypothetical protein
MNRWLLKSVMERTENWPETVQKELLEYALEIEARQEGTVDAPPKICRQSITRSR